MLCILSTAMRPTKTDTCWQNGDNSLAKEEGAFNVMFLKDNTDKKKQI